MDENWATWLWDENQRDIAISRWLDANLRRRGRSSTTPKLWSFFMEALTKWEPLGLDWPGQGTKTAGGSDPMGDRSGEGSDQGADQPELTDKEGTELIGCEVGRALP